MRSQSPGIRIPNVVDPSLNGSIEFGKGDLACAVCGPVHPQSPGEFDDVASFNPTVSGIDDEAQPGNAVGAWNNLCGRFVNGQPQAAQKCDDGLFPCPTNFSLSLFPETGLLTTGWLS